MQRYFSNIYWHFTGSPRDVDWALCACPKDILAQGKPQPPETALKTLFMILESKILLATCCEKITEKLHTQKFCCVTDIPLKDLELHSKYYGKVAIGFNCSRIHRWFNPVLYFPRFSFLRKYRIPKGGSKLIVDDYDDIDVRHFNVEKLPNGKFKLTLKDDQLLFWTTEIDTDRIDRYFADHLKVTEFSPKIGDSFYQEREWRHIGDFDFSGSDVEAVIIPKKLLKKAQEFILESEQFKHISILTWEILRMA